MARASIPTSLPLDDFAKIMNLNPVHFAGAVATNSGNDGVMLLESNSCADVWFQHGWQNHDAAPRELIARQIAVAEDEIAQQLGYWPAPRWFSEEFHPYPQPYYHEYFGSGYGVRGQRKGIKTRFGKVIGGGRRAVSLVGTATTAGGTLAYTDADLDGFYETATLTLPTSLTNLQEIKVYFTGEGGDETWEVRPVRSKTIAGANVVIVLDSWLLIDPDLWERYPPGGGLGAIDISTLANFVTSVDVYREYNDPTQAQAVFYWREPCTVCGGSGCAACSETTQNGCLTVIDPENGMVAPYPADYDATLAQWTSVAWSEARSPDKVTLYYYAGDRRERYLRGTDLEPMSWKLAQAISYMASARILGGFCSCVRVSDLVDWLQEDVSRLTQGASYFTPQEKLINPFGVKRGEVIAYMTCRPPQMRLARLALA